MVMRNASQDIELQALVFSALADPTRLRLLKLLSTSTPGALCVNALAGLLGVTQPAVSQHLRVLKTAGLVHGERRGYHIHYSVNPEALERCRDLITTALSTPEPEQPGSCRIDCRKGGDYRPPRRISKTAPNRGKGSGRAAL